MTISAPQRPRVTIGLPTFSRGHGLETALDSALGQTFEDIEVIVSDNASPDDTQAICEARAGRDPRLRYFRQDRNIGPQENWQFVLDQAQGEYFMWHADDDTYDPTFVEKAVAHLDENPGTLACFSDYDQVDENGDSHGVWRLPHLYPDADWREGQRDFFSYPYTLGTVTIYGLFRTGPAQAIGAPKPVSRRKLISGLEAPFLAHIAARGRIDVLPEVLFHYNNHAVAKDSLAHKESSGLRPTDKVLVYTTIGSTLVRTAIRANTDWRQRLHLAFTAGRALGRKLLGRPSHR